MANKVKILLVCAAGMSTSLLMTKMQQAADKKGLDIEIQAKSAAEADKLLNREDIDILLIGPQVRYLKKEYETKLKDRNIPVSVIDMRDYGRVDGEKVLNQVMETIGK